jgi:hypothetical protein
MTTDEIKTLMVGCGDAVKAKLPKGWGFVLIAAPTSTDLDAGGQFISDLRPGDGLLLMRETALRVAANLAKKS